jgi:hypothetical protein
MNKLIVIGMALLLGGVALSEEVSNHKALDGMIVLPEAKLADALNSLRAAVTENEMKRAVSNYPIQRIVIIESQSGHYKKILFNKEGLALKFESGLKVNSGKINYLRYGMLCHYILSSKMEDDRGEHNRVSIDGQIVELRVFFDDGSRCTLRCYYPWLSTHMWNVHMMIRGLDASITWAPTNAYRGDDNKIWGKSDDSVFRGIENEINQLDIDK